MGEGNEKEEKERGGVEREKGMKKGRGEGRERGRGGRGKGMQEEGGNKRKRGKGRGTEKKEKESGLEALNTIAISLRKKNTITVIGHVQPYW